MTNTTTNKSERNWVVVVGKAAAGEEVYLGSLTPGVDVSNGSAVKEDNRCGVRRLENALRFTKRGAERIAKGYTAQRLEDAGYAKQA